MKQEPITEKDLQSIASQLKNPSGEAGLKIASQMHESNKGMTMNSFEVLELKDKDRVLEIGHGNGQHVSSVLVDLVDVKYTGLEISQTMQAEAIHKNVEFVFRDQVAFELYKEGTLFPLDNSSYNKIITVNCIYFWSSLENVLLEIKRVLKKGGVFVITFADKDFMRNLPFVKYNFKLYNSEEVIAIASSLGFNIQGVYTKNDHVVSKSGEDVNRYYSILKFALE